MRHRQRAASGAACANLARMRVAVRDAHADPQGSPSDPLRTAGCCKPAGELSLGRPLHKGREGGERDLPPAHVWRITCG
eukprot:2452649-Prymnesium_polylepis.1